MTTPADGSNTVNEAAYISVIERTRIPIDGSAGSIFKTWPGAFGLLVAKFLKKKKLEQFEMQDQCQSKWCWAAVAASVSAFYDENSTHTQCTIANRQLNRPDCCTFPCHAADTPGSPNEPSTLGSALNYAGHVLELEDLFNKASRSQVKQEMVAQRPLCVRIQWNGGNDAHFVVIVGYNSDIDTLVVADSLFGPKSIDFEKFPADYHMGGKWDSTYYTSSPN